MKFYKLPEILFSGDKYKNMSLEAKVLYAMLADRNELSVKNGFVDEDGEPFVIFTRKEAADRLSVSMGSAVKYFKELRSVGLIFEKQRSHSDVKFLYITKIESDKMQTLVKKTIPEFQNLQQTLVKKGISEFQNLQPIYTDNNKTENNYTYSVNEQKKEGEELFHILENCELEIWKDGTGEMLEKSITELYNTESITANGRTYNKSQIRKILSELDGDCLIYAVESIKEKQGRIKNTALYLKSTILNARLDYLAFELM